jgi:hypothetical protein
MENKDKKKPAETDKPEKVFVFIEGYAVVQVHNEGFVYQEPLRMSERIAKDKIKKEED